MNKLNKLSAFEMEANRAFNYGGSKGYIGEDAYGVGGGYIGSDSYAGAGDNRLEDADRTVTVIITNTNTVGTANAILFGGFAEKSQPSGVTVDVRQSSHAQFRRESTVNVMYVKGFKYRVSDEDQFDEIIKIQEQTATGKLVSYDFDPLEYRTNLAQINTQIDATNFSFRIDGRTEWTFPIKFGVTAKLVLQIRTRTDQANLLKGESVIQTTGSANPTGLPQVDK